MTHLYIDLLGTFAATVDGRTVSGFRSNKVRALLAYLAVEADRPHFRPALSVLFWPEASEQSASDNFRLTLHRLRRVLDDAVAGAGALALRVDGGQVQINGDVLTLDVAVFLEHLTQVNAHGHSQPNLCLDCLERLEQAVTLYRGDLLPGFELADAPLFEEWLVVEQERLRRQCLWALGALAEAYQHRGDIDRALDFAARELDLDSYREEAYRRKMQLLALSGRSSEATACYLACERVLAQELGVKPDEETTALYNRILTGDVSRPQPAAISLINFPAQFTPLVGRETEMQMVRERLLDRDCRLLTLTGLGGVGKTRLAIEAARMIAAEPAGATRRFSDGIYYISLTSVDTPENLPAAMALVLGVIPHEGYAVGEQVIYFLRNKQMLLVLDNFEHLREGAVWLLSILESAPGIALMVTSRLPLDLRIEQRLALDGLAYPPAETAEDAMAYGAVQLFVQAARRIQPGYQLTPPDGQDVVRACELVKGLPLALELAASWLRILSCAGIVREIERSFEFLSTNLQDVPVRHRSVQAVFHHTWELLSSAQQRALAALAVFRGPFLLDDALAVADTSIVDLAALLDVSLVQRKAGGWYEIHFLLRQYALQQLENLSVRDASAAQAGRRHSEYYLVYLAGQEEALFGPEPDVAVKMINQRLDNIRQAWRMASQEGHLQTLERSLVGLARFYELSGFFQEGDQVLDWTAARLRELDMNDANPQRHASALTSQLLVHRAHFLNRLGQANEGIELLSPALTLAEQSGEPRYQVTVLSLLGELLPHQGKFALAQSYQEQAISILRAMADQRGLATALTRLGVTHWRRASYGDALACFQEALVLQRKQQDRYGIAKLLWSMGGVAYEQRQYAEALAHAQQAREIYQAIGDRWGMATLDGNLALLKQAQGDYEAALAYNQLNLDHDLETGYRHGEAVVLGNRGAILMDAGRLNEALACFQRAVRIQEELGNKWEVARHRASIASVWNWRNEPSRALAEYEHAIPVLRDHGARLYLIDPLLEEAHILIDQGKLAMVGERAREIHQLADDLGLDDRRLQCQILQARLNYAIGDAHGALAHLRSLAEGVTEAVGRATILFWLWKLGREEADRVAAEALYEDLYRRFPKYAYAMDLAAVRSG